MNAQDPVKPVLFDAYSDHYEQLVNESLTFSKLKVDFFIRVKAEYMQDILTAHFGDSSKVRLIDIGCGLGKYHPYWVNRVGLLQGVDVSAESIQRAAERNPHVAYKVYDGNRLPFADDSFDAVVTICVMHHVNPQERSSFVAELRRVTRPGGIAVVFEHNPLNLLTRRAISNCVFDEGVVLLPH